MNISFKHIDWPLTISAVLITLAGLFTMNSFSASNIFFEKQIVWFIISFIVFLFASQLDWRFIKKSEFIIVIYFISVFFLGVLFVFGNLVKGATSWFNFGAFSFQPVDFAKLVLIMLLSKYFSRRHIEIANIRHILVSGIYVFIVFLLVFLQPDFGSAIIIFFIWLGMVLVSGISKKHLLFVFTIGLISFVFLWSFIFAPYQKARIISFINPLTDIHGSGYNAYQSTIAVGSGGIFGKGIGLGTQSKLEFLPEYQTDFIFAAFAEEWGFVGVILLFILFVFLITRIISIAIKGESNFEILFGIGLAILFMTHIIINIGMNIGLLPVTGNTLSFMSYGGSHLLNEFLGLGILMGMSRYKRVVHKEMNQNEIVGIS